MSRSINKEIIAYVKDRKAKNPGLSVRKLSQIVNEKFSGKISKSSISSLLKRNSLSSPRGRRVTRIEDKAVKSDIAGFGVFLAAEKLTGVCEAIADALSVLPAAKVFQKETLEISTLAWLLSSMLYGTSFERAQEYEKNEIWGLVGRRVSQPTLRKYLHLLKSTELIKKHIVMEIAKRVSWVSSVRVETSSGDGFLMDAQQRSLWDLGETRHKYMLTSYFTSSYIMSCLKVREPISILSGGPEVGSHEPLKDLVSFDIHAEKEKSLDVYLIDSKSVRVSRMAVDPSRLVWIVGVWPWQIKSLFDKSTPPTGVYCSVDGEKRYPYRDTLVKIPQIFESNNVTKRMILVYFEDGITPRVALLTNVSSDELAADRVVSKYFSRFTEPEKLYGDLLESIKQPVYFEDVRSFEPLNESLKTIDAASTPQDLFRAIGEMVCIFSLRVFFPPSAWGWTAMKVKECYLKSKGTIRWNKIDSVFYDIEGANELSSRDVWDHIVREINSLPLHIGPLQKRLQIQISFS